MQSAGHSADQCDRLKKLLHGALMKHLQQVSASKVKYFQFWLYLVLIRFCLRDIRWLSIQKTCCHPLEGVKEWRAKAAEILLVMD
jgi:hypothetical protein